MYSEDSLDSEDSLNCDEEEDLENERVGNDEWCVSAMETYTKSLCCQETNKIEETYLQGRSSLQYYLFNCLTLIYK